MDTIRYEPGKSRESGRHLEQNGNEPGVVQRPAQSANHPLTVSDGLAMQRRPLRGQVARPERFVREQQVGQGLGRGEGMTHAFPREGLHIAGDVAHQNDTVSGQSA